MTDRLSLREEIARDPLLQAFEEGHALLGQVIDELQERATRLQGEKDALLESLRSVLFVLVPEMRGAEDLTTVKHARILIARLGK